MVDTLEQLDANGEALVRGTIIGPDPTLSRGIRDLRRLKRKTGDFQMVFSCPRGTEKAFRFKEGTDIRLGGCMVNDKFTIIKEVKKVKRGKK